MIGVNDITGSNQCDPDEYTSQVRIVSYCNRRPAIMPLRPSDPLSLCNISHTHPNERSEFQLKFPTSKSSYHQYYMSHMIKLSD